MRWEIIWGEIEAFLLVPAVLSVFGHIWFHLVGALLGEWFIQQYNDVRSSKLKTEESFAADAFEEDMNVFVPKTAWLSQLGDDVLLRYQERSVPFENRLLRLRSCIDRAVPYAALAAALLCAAAAIYSSYIAASLPPS